jgi:hypothetical protein
VYVLFEVFLKNTYILLGFLCYMALRLLLRALKLFLLREYVLKTSWKVYLEEFFGKNFKSLLFTFSSIIIKKMCVIWVPYVSYYAYSSKYYIFNCEGRSQALKYKWRKTILPCVYVVESFWSQIAHHRGLHAHFLLLSPNSTYVTKKTRCFIPILL